MKRKFLTALLVLVPLFSPIGLKANNGQEIVIKTPSGESLTLTVNPHETLFEITERIEEYFGHNDDGLVFEIPNHRRSWAGADEPQEEDLEEWHMAQSLRDYHAIVNQNEKDDIRYIVTFLGNKAWPKIAANKQSLKNAGDRIDHIHPLRFLQEIFTKEELKAGIHNIHSKSLVWKNFFGGLRDSLNTESLLGNLSDDYVREFAKNVNIDPNLILEHAQQRRWTDFMSALLNNIPRTGNPKRYDS